MKDAQAKAFESLSPLIEKIALELVFTQPGSDAGLLPINSFVSDMEEITQSHLLPAPILDAIAKARGLVDSTFTTGHFTRQILDQLHAWVPWFKSVLAAVENGAEP